MSRWHKNKWQDKADVVVTYTKTALHLVHGSLNNGQQQKIMKDEKIKELFERYGGSV